MNHFKKEKKNILQSSMNASGLQRYVCMLVTLFIGRFGLDLGLGSASGVRIGVRICPGIRVWAEIKVGVRVCPGIRVWDRVRVGFGLGLGLGSELGLGLELVSWTGVRVRAEVRVWPWVGISVKVGVRLGVKVGIWVELGLGLWFPFLCTEVKNSIRLNPV